MEHLVTAVQVLQSYGGRDKAIRTIAYALNMAASRCTGERNEQLTAAARQFSTARLIGRQLNDIPMLLACMGHLGKKTVEDPVAHHLDGFVTFVYTLYTPLEHIAWLCDLKLLSLDGARYWRYCIYIWLAALCATLIK